ncbi:MAG: ATP-binding protein [Lachnospiraceae bacterium]|nr:ATP-binding protein [Lachnospiraceae bacterium]
MFIDRDKELAVLETEYARKGAAFVVIYGRRRIGKTTLINRFCENKKAIYFLTTEENEDENRTSFKNLVAAAFADELLESAAIDSWIPIFKIIAKESRNERLVLVIDEFQYLGKANKAFPSVMQKVWDEILSKANVMLILCGSLINMMTSQVLNYDSPLYGRRTAQIMLKQIDFSHCCEFNKDLTMEEQIEQYAVTGGVPKYIQIFDRQGDIYSSIREHILSSGSFLYAEPEFLLQKEVSEIGSYFSVLKTIAAGNHKLGRMASALEVSQSGLTPYLRTLVELDIIEREVPITEEHPEKSKMGLYRIKDNFIAFWFKFVYPSKSMLESEKIQFVEDRLRQNFIDNHVSYVYEDICREDTWNVLSEGISINRVGRWWGSGDVEIDIVAYDSTGNDMVFGECKYSMQRKGLEIINKLQEKAKAVDWKKETRREHYLIYAKSGFTDELLEYAAQRDDVILKQFG